MFQPGQRWLCEAEPALGLGTVLRVEGRLVTIVFMASSDTRTYSIETAPLSRVQFNPGDWVEGHDGQKLHVDTVENQNGVLIYHGHTLTGDEASLHEQQLGNFIEFNQALDRLLLGQIDDDRFFQLRGETLDHLSAWQTTQVKGLLGGRVSFIPHQLYVARQIATRWSPRVMLADEVGLGKTIEAGMILHAQLLTGRANRVLILVPESLQFQWLVELKRRFSLEFSLYDRERLQQMQDDGLVNLFEENQLIICSHHILASDEAYRQQMFEVEWDLLVVDEAHHIQWHEQHPSSAYQTLVRLCEAIPGVLLLTATPEQLGEESHFARLRLLDPLRYQSFDQYLLEKQQYRHIADLAEVLQAGQALNQAQATLLGEILPEALNSLDENGHLNPQLLDEALNELLDRYGPGRVMMRNRRAVVNGFPQRILNTYALQRPIEYSADPLLAQAQSEYELEWESGTSLIQSLLSPELAYKMRQQEDLDQGSDSLQITAHRHDQDLGKFWWLIDPRVAWLKAFCSHGEKVLLICHSAESAAELERFLRLNSTIRTALFSEQMNLVERDRAAAYFADLQEGAQLLICSEVGSEGRNFQFARHLVMFDLPFHPDLLEQRIGRLDRIGQLYDVQIHVPYFTGTAQHIYLDWLDQGLNAFRRVSTSGAYLFEQFGSELCRLLAMDHFQRATIQPLIDLTLKSGEEIENNLEHSRDILLELNSCRAEEAGQLIDSIMQFEAFHPLEDYMERVWDSYGVEVETDTAHSLIVRPGDHMLVPHFPALPEDGLKVSFNLDYALSNETVACMRWEHPMVLGAMDLVLAAEHGNTSFVLLESEEIESGQVLIEQVYTAMVTSKAGLDVERFFPQQMVRVVLDADGHDMTAALPRKKVNRLVQAAPLEIARKAVKAYKEDIAALVEQGRQQAERQAQQRLAEARQRATEQLHAEAQRMAFLLARNAMVRTEELDFLQHQQQAIEMVLQNVQLKLDALRVIVCQ